MTITASIVAFLHEKNLSNSEWAKKEDGEKKILAKFLW
jgi:hypothetical protein